MWRSVLKLQSRGTSSPHCDRDCHPPGDKTKEGCAPHRLTGSTANTHIRKPRRLQNLIQKINNLTSRTTAVLQWIRANNDIHENKVADQLPKEGSMKQKSLSETRG